MTPSAAAARKFVVSYPPFETTIGHYVIRPVWWGRVPPQAWSVGDHVHATLVELSSVSEGRGVIEIQGRRHDLRSGNRIVVFPGEFHRLSSLPGGTMGLHFLLCYVELRNAALNEVEETERGEIHRLMHAFLNCHDRVRPDRGGHELGRLFAAIQGQLETRPPGWREACRALLRLLVLGTARLFADPDGRSGLPLARAAWRRIEPAGARESAAELMDRVSDHIAKHLQDQPKVAEVARALGVSLRTLQRLIESEGTTFRGLLSRTQIFAAKYLLVSTDLPVKDIATRAGYEDASHFSAIFRRQFGLVPNAYRALRSGE